MWRSGPVLACLLVTACVAPNADQATGFSYQTCEITPEGTVCEPGTPLPPGAVAPKPPVEVVASADGFAGVALGTPLDQALPRLTALLGEPERDEGTCIREELRESLSQPLRGQELSWRRPELTAFFTRSPSGAVLLTGWEAYEPRLRPVRYDLRLPYDVRLGAPVDDALAVLPQGQGAAAPAGSSEAGSFVVTTPAQPDLLLTSTDLSGRGDVYTASYDPEGCR